jgi:tetratricopeptide (TPR) repeat protein
MTTSRPRHAWAVPAGADARDGETLGTAPIPHVTVSCNRRFRGPYTGAGALLRRIAPEYLADAPEAAAERATNMVAIAPELAGVLPLPDATLTEAAGPTERTRFYSAGRTERLVHGIAEILMDWARLRHPEGVVVSFADVGEADATDRELIRVLLRRCDPARLRIVVECGEFGEVDTRLDAALARHTERVLRRPVELPTPPPGADPAQLYIESDCTSPDPLLLAAYHALPAHERARRHTARAEALSALGEPSLGLGAIPFHHEHGVDPSGTGGEELLRATTSCLNLGYYHASMELAERGRLLVTAEDQPNVYWNLTTKVAACHSYLGPAEKAAGYLGELRSSLSAEMHMRAAYMTAMLYTRYFPKDAQNHALAREWSNISIIIADNYPKPERRVFNGAFMRNGRALVELHCLNLQGALDLVNEAVAMTDEHLSDEEQLLHRSVLTHNRAQVLAAMGDHAGALQDYDEVIRRDPNYGEYYFDRATVRRNAGLVAEALEDYAAAIRLTPPFHEAHYNRADLLRELGDDEGALRDLDYALELEPDHVDSLLNRADLFLAAGAVDQARADIDHGLSLDPENARLLSALGGVLAESGETDQAWASYTAALTADPALAAAWANRAILAFATERPEQAIADLTEAIRLADDPLLRSNRAIALQETGDHDRAVVDLDAALAAGADDPDLLYRRGLSRHALGDLAGARLDWREHLAAYPAEESPYLEEIRAVLGAGGVGDVGGVDGLPSRPELAGVSVFSELSETMS